MGEPEKTEAPVKASKVPFVGYLALLFAILFFSGMFAPLVRSQSNGRDDSLSDALERYLKSPAVSDRADDDVSIVLATQRTHPSPE